MKAVLPVGFPIHRFSFPNIILWLGNEIKIKHKVYDKASQWQRKVEVPLVITTQQ